MENQPVVLSQLRLKKALMRTFKSLIGIDRGCTLTKVVYFPKSATPDQVDNDETTRCELHLATFANTKFEAALEWILGHAQLPSTESGGQLRVTGVGCESHKELIQLKLGLTTVFVNELDSHVKGLHFLLSNYEDEEFCYPPEQTENLNFPIRFSETVTKKLEKMQDEMNLFINNNKFPAVFGICGSGIMMTKINEDCTAELAGLPALGGKAFMGLNRLLLNTQSFDEIEALANSGDRGNVDDQVKDMMQKNGAYGNMPPDESVFNFGKAAEKDRHLSSFKREDIASAIVGFAANHLMNSIFLAMGISKSQNIYLGGSLIRNSALRKELVRQMKLNAVMGLPNITIKYVQIAQTGAIGAMVAHLEDKIE